MAATAELLSAGRTPTATEIAEAADVSRRTLYQHFPTLDQLLLDATVGLLGEAEVDAAIEAADTVGDASERVAAMVRALCGLAEETLPLGRSLLGLTVTAPPPADGSPKRGYRRIGWIERALEPLRDQLDEAAYERLVSALAMVAGWEALIVLADLRGLDEEEQVDVSVWAARALIDAAVRDVGELTPG